MTNYATWSMTLVLFTTLVSCEGQVKQTSTSSNAPSEMVRFTPAKYTPDTLLAPNAPARITRRIRQDAQGNLLMASFTDVIRYDGTSFTKLPKPAGVETFDAFDALEDTNGHIWIASTHFGVYRFDGEDYTHFTPENGLAHNRTIDLFEDRSGTIWISTMDGVSRFDGTSFHNYTTTDGLPDNDVNHILEDRTGTIWIGTRGNACVFDGTTFTTINDRHGEPFTNVRDIIEDGAGNIWLGGGRGLWRYDGKNYIQISEAFVGNIHEDMDGHIWTLSAGGAGWVISKYGLDPVSDQVQLLLEEHPGVPMLFGITDDQKGTLWVGTGMGVLKYDGGKMTYFIRE